MFNKFNNLVTDLKFTSKAFFLFFSQTEGDVIAVRQMMFLSHSYDHRVVDGQLGGSFVQRVADYLEAFSLDRRLEE